MIGEVRLGWVERSQVIGVGVLPCDEVIFWQGFSPPLLTTAVPRRQQTYTDRQVTLQQPPTHTHTLHLPILMASKASDFHFSLSIPLSPSLSLA